MQTDLIEQIRQIPPVSQPAANEYGEKQPLLVEQVNRKMKKHPELATLIGRNPLQVMYDNHESHAVFMSNVFQLGLYETLLRVIQWVYRSYSSRGFSFDYFPAALQAWKGAVADHLQEERAREVITVYDWLLQQHSRFIELSREGISWDTGEESPGWQKSRLAFLHSLLQGNSQECLDRARASVQNREQVKDFYLQVIQPAMYEIGVGWEKGEVSVAQEHLASAIISRVMSALYQAHVLVEEPKWSRAVVTSAPNEFHEVGGYMVADFLEMEGWDVYYLGANTPVEDLRDILLDKRPFLLAVSVTMPFNLSGVKTIIETVQAEPELKGVKIMAGGMAFNGEPDLWKRIGADGWAANARDAVELAQKWYAEENGRNVE